MVNARASFGVFETAFIGQIIVVFVTALGVKKKDDDLKTKNNVFPCCFWW